MILQILIETLVALIATLSFAVIFNAPRRELVLCGSTGALGWLVYRLLMEAGAGMAVSICLATLALTVASRGMAVARMMPVTVYLLAGIFPLVPGAGVFYSFFYTLRGDSATGSLQAGNTITAAGAIALGIVLGFALPQKLFALFRRKR